MRLIQKQERVMPTDADSVLLRLLVTHGEMNQMGLLALALAHGIEPEASIPSLRKLVDAGVVVFDGRMLRAASVKAGET